MKKIFLLAVAFCSFVIGYGVLAEAYPAGGMYGRGEYDGYFLNINDSKGTFVLPKQYTGNTNAIDPSVNNATELINFLKGSEGLGGSAQQRTGAAFIIQTMIGTARNRPPTAAQIAEWESRVRYAESQGRISWFVSYSFCINTYWQGTNDGGSDPNDDAFFDDCGTDTSIVFRNASGGIAYVIKRECANPVGNVAPIPDAPTFNISGRTTITNSTNAGRGANPFPGDSIVFHHYVRNSGPGGTSPTNIWWIAQSMPSQTTVGGAANSGTYASGQEKNVFNHTINIPATAAPGTQYCERVGYDPTNGTGGSDGRGPTVCATVAYNFDLTPSVNPVVIHNGTPITGSFAEPGDVIQFTYSVNNGGTTESQSVTCTYRQATWPGNNEAAPTTVFTPGGANCPPNRTFPRTSNTDTATENFNATTPNTTICRSFTISPATQAGGSRVDQACIKVVAKPYARVWGGDVSVGNGLASAPGVCTANLNASVVGWNRGGPASYAGAGTQFATYALAQINEFATALYDPGGAGQPDGLSFANNSTNPAAGDYGGDFGSVPCIPDYYGQRPATTLPLPANITSMVTGNYGFTGNAYFSGGTNNINSGEQTTVYVDGNVYINTNIVYAGTWTSSNIPNFRMIVRGNIYIDLNVNQIDGIYIAQANSAGNGGEIYTCASTVDGYAAIPGDRMYNECTRKLTVNGAFIAKQVRLMRTLGTLSQSVFNETNLTTQAAEVFNFGPAAWIPQPEGDPSEVPDYDAIISLPPVL